MTFKQGTYENSTLRSPLGKLDEDFDIISVIFPLSFAITQIAMYTESKDDNPPLSLTLSLENNSAYSISIKEALALGSLAYTLLIQIKPFPKEAWHKNDDGYYARPFLKGCWVSTAGVVLFLAPLIAASLCFLFGNKETAQGIIAFTPIIGYVTRLLVFYCSWVNNSLLPIEKQYELALLGVLQEEIYAKYQHQQATPSLKEALKEIFQADTFNKELLLRLSEDKNFLDNLRDPELPNFFLRTARLLNSMLDTNIKNALRRIKPYTRIFYSKTLDTKLLEDLEKLADPDFIFCKNILTIKLLDYNQSQNTVNFDKRVNILLNKFPSDKIIRDKAKQKLENSSDSNFPQLIIDLEILFNIPVLEYIQYRDILYSQLIFTIAKEKPKAPIFDAYCFEKSKKTPGFFQCPEALEDKPIWQTKENILQKTTTLTPEETDLLKNILVAQALLRLQQKDILCYSLLSNAICAIKRQNHVGSFNIIKENDTTPEKTRYFLQLADFEILFATTIYQSIGPTSPGTALISPEIHKSLNAKFTELSSAKDSNITATQTEEEKDATQQKLIKLTKLTNNFQSSDFTLNEKRAVLLYVLLQIHKLHSSTTKITKFLKEPTLISLLTGYPPLEKYTKKCLVAELEQQRETVDSALSRQIQSLILIINKFLTIPADEIFNVIQTAIQHTRDTPWITAQINFVKLCLKYEQEGQQSDSNFYTLNAKDEETLRQNLPYLYNALNTFHDDSVDLTEAIQNFHEKMPHAEKNNNNSSDTEENNNNSPFQYVSS